MIKISKIDKLFNKRDIDISYTALNEWLIMEIFFRLPQARIAKRL